MSIKKLIEKHDAKPKVQTVTLRIPEDLYEWLKKEAERHNVSVNRLMEIAVRELKDSA